FAFKMRRRAEDGADGEHAGAADTGDTDVVGLVEAGGDSRFGKVELLFGRGPGAMDVAAMHRDEGGTETLQAGIVLVAARLVDLALAAELRLQRFHRDAVRLNRAVAAAFADGVVDEDAPRRILHLAALALAT